MTGDSMDAAAVEVFTTLLAATHLSRPDDLPDAVADLAVPLGISELVLYLVDYEQTALIPVPRLHAPVERSVLRIDGTLGGRAFSTTSVVEVDAGTPDRRRLWFPLVDGTDRLGWPS